MLCYETARGEHLVALKKELNKAVAHKGVEIVTISRPTAFGEYAPYNFIHDEAEFVAKVKAMGNR